MTIKGGKLRSILYMERQSRQENIIYLALWSILFAAPVLSLYLRTINDASAMFHWNEVFMIWRRFAIFLFIFFIHNFLIAPILVYRNKRFIYTFIIAAIIGCFMVYQCNERPKEMPGPPGMEIDAEGKPHELNELPPPYENGEFLKHPKYELTPNDNSLQDDNIRPNGDFPPQDDIHQQEDIPDGEPGSNGPKPMRGPDGKFMPHNPPAILGEHDIVATVILFLMLGMNLGIKLYFRSREDEKKLMALEKENLEQQLEYLKYQINPHFFMNTLNNIHALVDIDAEKAKSTILELSKMMRFILYEGNKNGVPLTREFEFIRNYITLMSLRYTDKVRINVDLPTLIPEKQVPPLMLITFIENAFKHGISYQHDSFININIVIKGNNLLFICRNSKANKPNQEKGGVGLTNVRKRLNLLFDKNYSLDITDENDIYNVQLTIPLS